MASTEPSSSLADRVQSLRLPSQGRHSSGSARLPWLLSFVLAGALIYLLLMGSPWKPLLSDEADDHSPLSSDTNSAGTFNATTSASTSDTAIPGEIALESKGYIIPEQQILVSPQVSGRIIELNFDAGERVKQDFVLAVLDNTEYLAECDRIKAMLESSMQNVAELEEGNRPDEKEKARAELAEAEANLTQALRELDREKELFERKIVSKEEFESTESLYKAAAQRVEGLAATLRLIEDGARIERKRMAKAQVQQIEAELRRAQWRLDNCVIRAPISGTILKKNAELGNLVNPVAFNGSFSLCDIADLSKLEVDLSIQERDISRVFKGQRCKVRSEAYPKRVYDGVVSRLMPIADRAKGAIPVRVRLTVPSDEEGVYLKPEMGAIVTFYNRDETTSAQETPQAANDRPSAMESSITSPSGPGPDSSSPTNAPLKPQ